jgi:hypothetical protein
MVVGMAINCRVSSRKGSIFFSETQPQSARSSSQSPVSSISFKQSPIFEMNSAFGSGHNRGSVFRETGFISNVASKLKAPAILSIEPVEARIQKTGKQASFDDAFRFHSPAF